MKTSTFLFGKKFMSETPVPQQPEAELVNPSIQKAKPDSLLKGFVASNERAFGLGRFGKSEKVGVVGDMEDSIAFWATELGLTQDSKELQTFAKFLKKKGAKEAFKAVADREMTGKGQEAQADFMSGGMASLKEMVLGLMEIKKEAKGSKEMEAEINELWDNFLSGSEEDRKAIRGFIEQANLAKREAWTNLKSLHKSQDLLDKANKFRSRADRVKSSTDPDKYRFTSMAGGPVHKFLSVISRFPGAVPRRFVEMFSSSDKNDESYETNLSVELRAKILTSGDTSQILEMWRNGVLSTNELGDIRKKLMADLAGDSVTQPLNADEAHALEAGEELKKFTNEAGVFVKADRGVQAKYFQDFFQQKQDIALEQYTKSQDKYLGFSFENAENWQKLLTGLAVDVDIVLPEWFKKLTVPMGHTLGKGVLTLGEDIGKEVGFIVDNMEGMIAGSALEDLSSAAVAREMAVENLMTLLSGSEEETDPKEVAKAAAVLRGAEASLTRAAMMVARATDTVSITEGKGLALSAILSPVELAEAGLDAATGGIMFRENAGKLLKELKDRAKKLLDGTGALSSATTELAKEGRTGEFAQKAWGTETAWFDAKVEEAGIPEEYMGKDSMNEHVNRNIFSRMAEGMRKAVGPETALAKKSQAWRSLTIGSKRQSVEEVSQATTVRRQEASVGVEYLKEKLAQVAAGAERANLAIQEATLISLREAQRNFTGAEIKQISERAKLDKMWRDVFAMGAGAAAIAVAATAAMGLDAISGSWVESAGASLGKAVDQLAKMKDGLVEIAKIAKEAGLPTAEVGGNWDVAWKEVGVFFSRLNLGSAELAQNNAPVVKTFLTGALAASPVLIALRSSWNLIPGKARAFTDIMKADKVENVNVV
jgi:hypothetical protein